MAAAGIPKRWAWTFLTEGIKFRAGRLYETFWNSQSNVKYTVLFLYPGALFWVRWRAETQYKYNVFIADKAPKAVRAGCYGRMMEDGDNLALAVRTFCKRDPKIVLWEEETELR